MSFTITDGNSLVLIKRFRLQSPACMREFPYDRTLEWADYKQAARGVVPLGPEDKWLVLQRQSLFSFYRSGNGVLLYRVRFVNRDGRFRSVRAEVNDDGRQVYHQPDTYEAELLDYLIDRLLLGCEARFPAPPGAEQSRARMLERLWMGSLAVGN